MRGGESGRLIIWGEKRYGEEMSKLYEGLTILQSRSREKARLQIKMLSGDFEEYCGKEPQILDLAPLSSQPAQLSGQYFYYWAKELLLWHEPFQSQL